MLQFILALLPILLILFLMVNWRWSAARAGAAGYLTALAIAMLFFGSGAKLLAYAHAKSILLTVDVLLIIWSAFLFYRVADEAGAVHTIGQALPHLTADPGMQALLIGWVFASFLQGVGGFGVPVAVVSPLLVSLGFTPLTAVVLPSIGHGWAVTFGSLGSSFQALIAATNISDTTLAPAAAVFLSISGLAVGAMVAHAAGGWSALRRLLAPVLVLGTVMGCVQYVVAVSGPWNIGSFSGAIAGLLLAIPLARRFHGALQVDKKLDLQTLAVAVSGYLALILITLGIQLIPVVKNFLGQVVIQVSFPEVSTALGFITPAGIGRKIPLFRHAGATLIYASVVAYLIYRRYNLYKTGAVRRIIIGTVSKVLSSSVSIVSMVSMAVVMEHAGMTDALARGMANGMGMAFPLIAPWIGAIGSFMTGSNTNSNVIFGALQLQTAHLLHYSPAIILAGQTAGAALASVIAPTKVVVGASTAGMAGREGEIMSQLLGYTGLLVLLVSLLTLAGIWLTG